MVASTVGSDSRKKYWPAWAGTRAHVVRILEAAEQQVSAASERAQDQAAEVFQGELTAIRGGIDSTDVPEDYRDGWRAQLSILDKRVESTRKKVSEAWSVSISTTSKGRQRQTFGDAETVGQTFDARRMRTFEISAPKTYTPHMSIQLRSALGGDLFLEVSGDDSAWVDAAFAELAREIARQVPWWSVFRRLWVLYLILVVPAVFATQAISSSLPLGLTASVFLGVLAGAFSGALVLGLRFWIPAFDVLEDGRKDRGGVVIGAFCVVVVQFAIGILVNLWN